MRHRITKTKLGRKAGPRKALMRGLATSFVLNGKMETTLIKAKTLRPVVEKQISRSRNKTLANKRLLMKFFYDEKAVKKLLEEIGPKYKSRPGGYTRIIKLGNRKGDNAPMAIIELV